MLLNKKIIKIISFTLIFITIFTFSVVLATDDSIYVWSTETEPLTTETSSTVEDTEETSGNENGITNKSSTIIDNTGTNNKIATSETVANTEENTEDEGKNILDIVCKIDFFVLSSRYEKTTTIMIKHNMYFSMERNSF